MVGLSIGDMGAILNGANLYQANLSGADFTDAEFTQWYSLEAWAWSDFPHRPTRQHGGEN